MVLLTVVGPRDSFHLIATFGISVNVMVALLSPAVGAYIDRSNRLTAVVLVTVLQNMCVVVCAFSFILLLATGWGPTTWQWALCVVLVHVGGGLNVLFQGLSNVILERDWVIVIAQGEDAWLREMTANLKSIDLSCNLVAPVTVSLLQLVGYGAIAVVLSAANFGMCYLQYAALRRIYHLVPALAKDESPPHHSLEPRGDAHHEDDDAPTAASSCRLLAQRLCGGVQHFFANGRIYARQRSFLPGLALAMLFLTVLSFHMVMISYLLMRGLRVVYIGIAQGVSSGLGVLGTLCYAKAAARLGTIRVGVVAIWAQVACLTVCVGALYFPPVGKDGAVSLAVFMGTVALSRVGLYAFDVAAAQLFQYIVEEQYRGVVGGFQRTLESLFEMASYVLVLWLPHPEQFPTLAAISYLQTVAAGVAFSIFACRTRVRSLQEEQGHAAFDGGLESSSPQGTVGTGTVLSHRHQDEVAPMLSQFARLSTFVSVGTSLRGEDEDDEEEQSGGATGDGAALRV